MMKGVCLRYSKNEQEAEDLLQDSFIKAFHNMKTFQNKGALGGWLRKLTLNTALEQYRKDKKSSQTIELREVTNYVDDEAIENLEENSLDFYASVKSLYLQDRQQKIANMKTVIETLNDSDWEEIENN